jgi:hypothetical protein
MTPNNSGDTSNVTHPAPDEGTHTAHLHRQVTDPAANPAPGPVAHTPYGGRQGPGGSYPRPMTRDQRTTVVYGILCFCLILVILQLWLLVATTNAYLGGDASIIWPGVGASALCLLLNLGLLRYLYALEHT